MPEHPLAEYYVRVFYRYGIGLLGERGLPDGGRFRDALPLIGVHLEPNATLLYEIFMAAASGLNEADKEARDEREAERKRK